MKAALGNPEDVLGLLVLTEPISHVIPSSTASRMKIEAFNM
jgi:hypothetical protein